MFEMSVLRKICWITRKDRRNVDILKELSIEKDIVDLLQVRRLTYFGHVNRMGNDRFPKLLLNGYTHWHRSRERPKRNGWTISVRTVRTWIHCVSKKVPAFKLSVTLSNLNRFPKFLHCWKAGEICYKTTQHYPPYLRHFATLPWDIKNSNFVQIFCRYGKNAKKLHFQFTDFNSSTCITVYAECIYVFLSKSGPCSWMPCWLLTNTAVTSFVTNFHGCRLIAK